MQNRKSTFYTIFTLAVPHGSSKFYWMCHIKTGNFNSITYNNTSKSLDSILFIISILTNPYRNKNLIKVKIDLWIFFFVRASDPLKRWVSILYEREVYFFTHIVINKHNFKTTTSSTQRGKTSLKYTHFHNHVSKYVYMYKNTICVIALLAFYPFWLLCQ